MFDTLQQAPADKIIGLIGLYRDDPREGKVDLGVGVYRNAAGATPIIGAVRKAEQMLHDTQATKAYLGLTGDAAFNHAIAKMVLGDALDEERVRACQAPGGSGALRILAELLVMAAPGATIWMSDPTWANHVPLITSAGLKADKYPYFDAASGAVRFDAMMETLGKAPAGDIVLLHGCCHNPTGANLTAEQWEAVADLIAERGLLPFVDLAYQGFGDGLDEDAAGVRTLAVKVPEMVVAVSCSKNFSVYRDRTGVAIVMGRNAKEADISLSQLGSVGRRMYSMPPDHGAAVVRTVLEDGALHGEWHAELTQMRERMLALRTGLADALRRQSNSDRFDFLAVHRGMFSRLGLTLEQVQRLRSEHAIYMVDDSRINVAGLPDERLDQVAAAIVSVLGD
ncbi:MAG: aspartate/tyrosine/aromatic aminotransferase [Brucellaceae bacterium]|nr:aspartate/tyrosine/aromatic aminotransferase [Brucellaceae bacterium]